jgi:GGDEF domain-containing protein
MGAAVYPDDGTDQDALMNNADAAMYRSKEAGRNCFRLFSAAGSPDSRP